MRDNYFSFYYYIIKYSPSSVYFLRHELLKADRHWLEDNILHVAPHEAVTGYMGFGPPGLQGLLVSMSTESPGLPASKAPNQTAQNHTAHYPYCRKNGTLHTAKKLYSVTWVYVWGRGGQVVTPPDHYDQHPLLKDGMIPSP
jgi:hypothetical protein